MSYRMIKLSIVCLILAAAVIYLIYGYLFSGYKSVEINSKLLTTVEKMKKYRGYCYINDGIQIQPLKTEIGDKIHWFENFVRIGDKLVKDENTSFLTLIRKDSSYTFYSFGQ